MIRFTINYLKPKKAKNVIFLDKKHVEESFNNNNEEVIRKKEMLRNLNNKIL